MITCHRRSTESVITLPITPSPSPSSHGPNRAQFTALHITILPVAIPSGSIALQTGFSLAPPKRSRQPSKKGHSHSSSAPRVINKQAQARMDHNHEVKADRSAAEAARSVYLKRHVDKLSPFVTPQVGR